MIHADVDEAFGGESFDDHFVDCEFYFSSGKFVALKEFLGWFDPGDVCVAVDCETVWVEREDFIECLFESFDGLVGQSVDEVDVDGLESCIAQPFYGLLGHVHGLNAVYGLLDNRVIVLDADRGAVEAGFVEGLHVIEGEAAWVDFDSGFVSFGEVEVAMDFFAECTDFVG